MWLIEWNGCRVQQWYATAFTKRSITRHFLKALDLHMSLSFTVVASTCYIYILFYLHFSTYNRYNFNNSSINSLNPLLDAYCSLI